LPPPSDVDPLPPRPTEADFKRVNDDLEAWLATASAPFPPSTLIGALTAPTRISGQFATEATNLVSSAIPGTPRHQRARQLRQQDVPGFQAAMQAAQEIPLPSFKLPVLPFPGLPLPGGRRFQRVQLGLQGAGELAFDPINAPFVAAPIAGAVRGAARGAVGAAGRKLPQIQGPLGRQLPVQQGGVEAVAEAQSFLRQFPEPMRSKITAVAPAQSITDVSVAHGAGDIRVFQTTPEGVRAQVAHELGHMAYKDDAALQARFVDAVADRAHPSRLDEFFAEAFEEFVSGKPMDTTGLPAGNFTIRGARPELADDIQGFMAREFPDLGNLGRQLPVQRPIQAAAPVRPPVQAAPRAAAADALRLTEEESARLVFLKGHLQRVEEIKDFRPLPNTPGYRPPPPPTAARRAEDIADATSGVDDAKAALKDAKAIGADAEELADARAALTAARAELREAKKPFDTEAFEKAIAAADEFDATIAASTKRIRDEVAALEAKQAAPRAAAPKPSRFTLLRESAEELGEASLAAIEAGGQEAALGPVRRLRIFDKETQQPLLAVTAQKVPAGTNIFQVEVRGLGPSGPLAFDDPALRGAFNRRELFEIADSIMNELGATELIGFRLGREAAGIRSFTRAQVDQVLGRPTTTPRAAAEAPEATLGAGERALTMRFLTRLRPFEDDIAEVVTSDNAAIRALIGRTFIEGGVNPSILKNTPVGRALVAYQRQRIAAENLVETGLTAAWDIHAQRFTGRSALPISSRGFYGTTGRRWEDVFSRPSQFQLPAKERAAISDLLGLFDEVEMLRRVEGLKPRTVRSPDGWFYVPRQVKEARGVELRRPSNPNLQRIHEFATDGAAQGVVYSNNPRANAGIHLRAAFDEIIEKRLSDALEPHSITPSRLVPDPVRIRMEQAVKQRLSAELAVRRLIVGQVRGRPAVTGERTLRRDLRKATASQLRQAKTVLASARDEFRTAEGIYSGEIAKARRAQVAPGHIFGRAEDNIPVATWRNRIFPRGDADELRDALGAFGVPRNQMNVFTRAFNTVGNYVRMFASVFDFALPFIHGYPVLAENPVAWVRGTWRHYISVLDPTIMSRYLRQNVDDIAEMANHGIPIGNSEFFQALREGQGLPAGRLLEFLPNGQEVRRIAQQGGRQSFGRFQAAYDTGLLVWRTEMWKAKKASRFAPIATPSERAGFIRNLTGGLDSRALGVGPSQRGIESMWMAFSPRLLRATAGLVKDALSPSLGAQQQAARVALLKVASATTGMYVLSGLALGKSQEEVLTGLNPLNGKKFLSHEINGDWVGVGGQIRAIIQLFGGLYEAGAPGGRPIDDLVRADMNDNPFIQAWLFRGPVGVSLVGGAVEAATGGEVDILPFDNIDSVPDLFKHVGTSALPMAIQGNLEGEQAMTTALAALGARTSPETPSEKRDTARAAEMEKRGLTGTFYELPGNVQRDINEMEGVQGAQAEVDLRARKFGSDFQKYQDEQDDIDIQASSLLTGASERMEGAALRKRIDVILRDRRRDLDSLEVQYSDALKDVLDFIDENRGTKTEFDIAQDDYTRQVFDPSLIDPVTEIPDFDERDRRMAALIEKYGQDMIDRIQDDLRRNEHPIVTQLREDREYLKDYWRFTSDLAEAEGLTDQLDDYNRTPVHEQTAFRINHPELDDVFRDAALFRLKVREFGNPDFERKLLRWGYAPFDNSNVAPLNKIVRDEMLAGTVP
tara:strand:+ start:1881 stop:7004 length:5124 start_codon:yes stop_codon:yes gene_type:complete